MIHQALDILTANLNDYLYARLGVANLAVQETLLTQNGTITPNINNRIVASVINMEEDRISRSWDIHRRQLNGTIDTTQVEIRFNIYLLFTAHFPSQAGGSHYNAGLRALSGVIGFFQSKHAFDQNNTPTLPNHIEKLLVEHYSLTLEQQNHLWGALGAKYLPSILYKVRLFVFQEEPITPGGPPITTVDIQSQESSL